MARRSDHTKEELRGLAIQCGIELIEEKGFSKFSARAVATKMGYTVGTLYHVFGNLDQFILQINATTLDRWLEELRKNILQRKGSPVKILAEGYVRFAKNNTQLFTALFEHRWENANEIPSWYVEKMESFFILLEEALNEALKDRKKAKRLAKILWSSIHGITVLSLSGKLELTRSESETKMIEYLLEKLVV